MRAWWWWQSSKILKLKLLVIVLFSSTALCWTPSSCQTLCRMPRTQWHWREVFLLLITGWTACQVSNAQVHRGLEKEATQLHVLPMADASMTDKGHWLSARIQAQSPDIWSSRNIWWWSSLATETMRSFKLDFPKSQGPVLQVQLYHPMQIRSQSTMKNIQFFNILKY